MHCAGVHLNDKIEGLRTCTERVIVGTRLRFSDSMCRHRGRQSGKHKVLHFVVLMQLTWRWCTCRAHVYHGRGRRGGSHLGQEDAQTLNHGLQGRRRRLELTARLCSPATCLQTPAASLGDALTACPGMGCHAPLKRLPTSATRACPDMRRPASSELLRLTACSPRGLLRRLQTALQTWPPSAAAGTRRSGRRQLSSSRGPPAGWMHL